MSSLSATFERDAREALLDQAESELVGQRNSLVFRFIQVVHSNLESYANRHGYNIESTKESLQTPEVRRNRNTLEITVGWDNPQMGRWEFGIRPHEIQGNPILSFVWADPPEWVKEEFDQARSAGGQFASGWRVFFSSVSHPGIPESRAIRDALNGLNEVLE
jgi:hypothetical protein